VLASGLETNSAEARAVLTLLG